MTRKSRREIERVLDDLGGEVPPLPRQFVVWYGEEWSEERLRDEWAAVVREGWERDIPPLCVEAIRLLRRARDGKPINRAAETSQ